MKKLPQLLFLISITISAQESYLLQINRLSLPFDNKGNLADVIENEVEGGRLDSINFLFSAGFWVSGKHANDVWANGMATSSRIEDYQPGNVDSIPYDPKYGIYLLLRASYSPYEPFGFYWQKWKYAVKLGADFYDGEGDGIYNPVDLNGNNQWDANEDSPDIIGDFTAWCVFNDGAPSEERSLQNEPLGIEVEQTIFAFHKDHQFDALSSTVFVRYKIKNTGKVSNVLDSVYFGGWADTDIGGVNGYFDDLAGCDISENSGYIYNDEEDNSFGINPPAHFIKILQGPISYIPGKTFVDDNFNGEYDEGIDTPIDTGFVFKGGINGIDTIPGAQNLGMTSFIHYMCCQGQGSPGSSQEMRNYMLGKDPSGDYYDPCYWVFGTTPGINCTEVNPAFMYSGDPVTNLGWINNTINDQRQLVSSGPFTLETGNPVTIIIAHIVGRGTNSLNSITVAREYSKEIEAFYKSNFTEIPVYVQNEISDQIPTSFHLYQNYPNPFNPTTNFEFRIADFGLVSLKVFDILGREVETLVNEEKSPGTYYIQYNASSLSNGIYFYELRSENFFSVKKMILLK